MEIKQLIISEGRLNLWAHTTLFSLLFVFGLIFNTIGIQALILTLYGLYIIYLSRLEAGLTCELRFYYMGAYLVLISGLFALTTVGVVRFLAGLIWLIIMMAMQYSEEVYRWTNWAGNIFKYFFGALSKYSEYFHPFNKENAHKSRSHKILAQLAIGVLIAIPLLIVAVTLLSSADVIFSEILTDLALSIEEFVENFDAPDLGRLFWRLLFLILLAPTLYGMSIYLKSNQTSILTDLQVALKTDADESQTGNSIEVKRVNTKEGKSQIIAPTISGTVLVLLNMVYLIFAYVQITFLFLGNPADEIVNYSYSTYAREGFF